MSRSKALRLGGEMSEVLYISRVPAMQGWTIVRRRSINRRDCIRRMERRAW